MINIINARWATKHQLNQSFKDSLGLFYRRIPRSDYNNRYFADTCIDRLLNDIANYEEIDWCIVHSDGVVYNDQSSIPKLFLNHIESLDPRTLVTGQLIDKKGYYCGIHEQCFAVNMRVYRELGRPRFGNYEDNHYELTCYEAGPSLHDDYTPKWIKPSEGEKERCRVWTCGWSFVNHSIKNGLSIVNLPDEIRKQKTFAYPSDELEKFNKNIDALFAIERCENVSQNRMLLYLISKKLGLRSGTGGSPFSYETRKGSVFAFNTELLHSDPKWIDQHGRKLNLYLGPCSGVLEFANLCSFGFDHNTKIHYYDINSDSIAYKKEFWDNFSGDLDDLLAYATNCKQRNQDILIDTRRGRFNIDQLRSILEKKGITFRQLFEGLKQIPKEYHRIDFLSNYSDILSLVENDDVAFLSYSDIFLGQNELLYGIHELKHRYQSFLMEASQKNNLIVQGKNLSDTPYIGYAKDFESLGWVDTF